MRKKRLIYKEKVKNVQEKTPKCLFIWAVLEDDRCGAFCEALFMDLF